MTNRHRLFPLAWLWLAVAAFTFAPVARAAEPPAPAGDEAKEKQPEEEKTTFLRFVDDGKGGGRLESAIVTYRNADGATVHLVAALHLGEKSYYDGLSKTFEGYDALLYELVKPKDASAPAPKRADLQAVGGLQQWMGELLELKFQLDAIDYTKPNFVHADLDAETFVKMQEERGETMFSLMLRAMQAEMQRQAEGKGDPAAEIGLFDLIAAFASPDSARQLKLLLARQFQNMEAQMAALEGEEGSVILGERNKAALKVLKETVAAGKKNVGVFYGAGHMSGLEAGLVEMGFKPDKTEWRVAWDLTTPPDPADDGAGAAEKADEGAEAADGPAEAGAEAEAEREAEPAGAGGTGR